MNKDLVLLILFGGIVTTQSVWLLLSSVELTPFVMGVNLGVGLIGVSLSALKLLRPDKYRFSYELDEYQEA
jgi:hypothetical protein